MSLNSPPTAPPTSSTTANRAPTASPADSPPAERVPWHLLKEGLYDKFDQGQHLAIIGPTGQGKTTLAVELLDDFWEMGASELVAANKPRDDLMEKLEANGWPRIYRWPPDYEHRARRRVLLWPHYGRASQAERNRAIFEEAFDYTLLEGGWVLYLDETRYFVETLKMRQQVDELWNGSRSSRITLMTGSQGTTWINKTMIRQETWMFLFKPRGIEERKEYADATGDKGSEADLLSLGEHEFLLVHLPSGERYVSKVGT